jgi:hypothetical protein
MTSYTCRLWAFLRHLIWVFSPLTATSWPGIRFLAVLLQDPQGKGVGLYLAVSSFHLPRPAKLVEGLVRHQEHQYLVFAPEF